MQKVEVSTLSFFLPLISNVALTDGTADLDQTVQINEHCPPLWYSSMDRIVSMIIVFNSSGNLVIPAEKSEIYGACSKMAYRKNGQGEL